jgi:threonine/homoserine/homoserine lactone efflux protein
VGQVIRKNACVNVLSRSPEDHYVMSIADNLLAFTFAATVLTLTPGLDTALVLRTATVEGKRQAFHAALGINAGCLLWGAAVAFGLGALIAVSELAFSVLKYCGAAYLAWLGANMLLHPRRSLLPVEPDGKPSTNWLLKGMAGNLLNPKIGVFYVSFLPQFIPQGEPLVAWTFGLVSIHVVIGLLWSVILIAATQQLAGVLRRAVVIQWMDRATGMIFVLFATRLALSKR